MVGTNGIVVFGKLGRLRDLLDRKPHLGQAQCRFALFALDAFSLALNNAFRNAFGNSIVNQALNSFTHIDHLRMIVNLYFRQLLI